MGGLAETITGLLNRRQLSTTYVPVFAFLVAVAAVIASGLGWSEAVRAWRALDPGGKVLVPVVVVAVTMLLGQFLQAGRLGLVRLLEGYWDGLPRGRSLAARCRAHHKALYESAGEQDMRRWEYPKSARHLMPTTLGNVLRGAERHSMDRYGLDGVSAWWRLYPTLPDGYRQLLAEATADLEAMVAVSVLGALYVPVAGTLAICLLPWDGAVACVLGGGAAAWAAYQGAVGAARAYGQLYRAAFDVHRWNLLDAMGLTRPTGYGAERDQWRALNRLWVLGAVDTDATQDLGYPDSPGGQPEPAPRAPARPVPASVPDTVAPLRLGRRAAVALLVLAALAAVLAATRPDPPPVCRTRTTLSAYHQLTSTDLRGPDCDALVGRYVLRPMAADAAPASRPLGPELPKAALSGREVAVLTAASVRQFASAVDRGATVSALVVPPRGTPRSISGLIVLDVRDNGRGVVLAGPPDAMRTILTASTRDEVHLLTGAD
ncbi:hypothetical protein [Streptomyces avermitilis]|uniref:Uncharacterized protein n=1 Tax=Streptomyces avermitilis TaxID=33903 RepID=A0A4D4MGJ4_STRAX|nr:hypothetical protein [Streptomyces avermitilis]GDY68669.1 hypothetical protein SAV14893_080620 [Streptomyces avermitilis]GDY70956.1 hypothetical protein SAV31267_004410 [Streptomyces avermitilis]